MMNRAAEFEAFVRAQRGPLLHSALLLTAGDRHLAEDVVQSTLLRLYVAWPRARLTNVTAYARRALINCLIDHVRRPSSRREVLTDDLPEIVLWDDEQSSPSASAIWAALRDLPVGMRSAVVLRHVEDLSVEDAARAMNCSRGTVKSQTARGLDKIRQALVTHATASETTSGGAGR